MTKAQTTSKYKHKNEITKLNQHIAYQFSNQNIVLLRYISRFICFTFKTSAKKRKLLKESVIARKVRGLAFLRSLVSLLFCH